jgi:hypothetical protein
MQHHRRDEPAIVRFLVARLEAVPTLWVRLVVCDMNAANASVYTGSVRYVSVVPESNTTPLGPPTLVVAEPIDILRRFTA